MSGWLVAVEGPSASGKSRTVREMSRRLGATEIHEAYDRVRPRLSLSWTTVPQLLRLEQRLLREDARRYREGRRLAATGATVLTDTGFLGPLTYTAGLVRLGLAPRLVLNQLLGTAREWCEEGRWGLPDAILYLRTPLAERRRRAEGDPRRHPAPLRARHQAVAAYEQRFYRTVVRPELGERFRSVSGTGTPNEVVARLVDAMTRFRARTRRPSSGRILDAIEHDRGVP